MLLLAGLGNPGASYASNRHNIGFMAVEAIAERHNFQPWRKRFSGLCAEGMLDGEKCLALKPMTFMNESGRAVAEAARFYKLEPDEVIVFHDELDLAPGKVRVKTGGGVAGHNGLRSIGQHLGNDFRRVRIGIGHPGHKDRVHGHVLKDFSRAEMAWVDPLVNAIGENAALLAKGDEGGFMNKLHVALGPDRAEEKKQRMAARPAPKKPAATNKPASSDAGKAPSQRDLARAGARGKSKRASKPRPEPAEQAAPAPRPEQSEASGPFAALKRLISGDTSSKKD